MKISAEKVYRNSGNSAIIDAVTDSDKSILDIGCGFGDNARILARDGRNIDGITLSEEEARNAGMYLNNVYIHNLENGLPLEIAQNKYDIVICSHVIEHIAYPEKLLSDVREILSHNGKLIIALPNIMIYQARFQLLLGNFNYKETGIWDYTHLRWYTYKSAKNLLITHNFKIINSFVTGDLPGLTITKFIPYKLRQWAFKNIFVRLSKGLFGGQIVLIAKK
ncbi:2-polyprenyl-3-methyl-5-hydroxy-6-metoxy-1,4-benzoquinol methylase [Runella defluvii]|uniref:2-polyprenyl-3-methyl-5-hydroxy-6-metoxy-1, 4-benzoquinol methylase n=1 Tax=Runella defluvii TaxID=370973 RepID=A0A7W5ZFK4_9BACT|nr:class I SAM-dependent methyltransferase [Runella defluvii]MBB3836422.1 2-polyprenyl-3-methyl-5-hydroxy-6-metoxy-1,4-benzoquinol methylase [Runella defluvii]